MCLGMNSHIRRPSEAENRAHSENIWRIGAPPLRLDGVRGSSSFSCVSCSGSRADRSPLNVARATSQNRHPMAESAFSLVTKEKAPPTRGKVAKEEIRFT
jgi:hypothetical protein